MHLQLFPTFGAGTMTVATAWSTAGLKALKPWDMMVFPELIPPWYHFWMVSNGQILRWFSVPHISAGSDMWYVYVYIYIYTHIYQLICICYMLGNPQNSCLCWRCRWQGMGVLVQGMMTGVTSTDEYIKNNTRWMWQSMICIYIYIILYACDMYIYIYIIIYTYQIS